MTVSMPAPFTHQSLRTRVVAQPGAIGSLGSELARQGCRRPLLLSSTRMGESSVYREVVAGLQELDYFEAGGIPQHSSIPVVMRIARLAAENRVDALVAVGGGSVSDTAKAVALVLAEGEPLEKHATRFVPPDTVIIPELFNLKLPIFSIPMTASGAEVTPSLGIRSEEGTKLLFWDAQLASRVILIDPAANLCVPAAIMLSTAMNGLAHCIEGLYSKAGSPIATALALDAMVRFDRAMRGVASTPDSAALRAELLIAAHMSGMVLASARSCLHHAICHVLGASCGVAHGAANAVILPHALRFNAPAAEQQLAMAARQLGLADGDSAGAAGALIEWMHRLQRECQVPSRLRDLGVSREALKQVAQKTMHERGLAYNPRQVHRPEEIEWILEAAW